MTDKKLYTPLADMILRHRCNCLAGEDCDSTPIHISSLVKELTEAREGSLPPQSAYFMQATGEGVCFAHGPYKNADRSPNCPKWPACITDPQKPEYLAISKAEGSLDRNPNAPCKNCGHPWDEEVAEAQQAMREGSLRTPAAPTEKEKADKLSELRESYEAGNLGWSEAVGLYMTWARGEASQPAPQPTPPFACDPIDPRFAEIRAEAPAQPTTPHQEYSSAPGPQWQDPAQPSPVKICKQCGKPFTDTTMWQLRVSCDECTFAEAEAPAQPSPGCGKMSYASQSSAQTYGPCHLPRGHEGKCSPLIEAAASPSTEPTAGNTEEKLNWPYGGPHQTK